MEQALGRGIRIDLCRNAYAGLFYCSHYAGRITPGTAQLSERGLCGHCEKSHPPYEEEPSWLRNDED